MGESAPKMAQTSTVLYQTQKIGAGQQEGAGGVAPGQEAQQAQQTGGIGEQEQLELRQGIKYHTEFLERNQDLVRVQDFPQIQQQANSNANVVPITLSQREAIAKYLHLPEGLYPIWKVEHQMYDIYFIPGYDNWMYNYVREDPETNYPRLSKYKQAVFDSRLEQLSQTGGTKVAGNSQVLESELLGQTTGCSKIFKMAGGSAIQHPHGVKISHTQFNHDGQHPSNPSRLEKTGILSGPEDNKLKTGTEFWQTSYQASIVDPYQNCTRKLLDPFNKNGEGPNKNDTIEDKLRKHRSTQCRTQFTEYNFSYGKYGSDPRSIMPPNSDFKPFINDPLK